MAWKPREAEGSREVSDEEVEEWLEGALAYLARYDPEGIAKLKDSLSQHGNGTQRALWEVLGRPQPKLE